MTRIALWILALGMGLACGEAQDIDAELDELDEIGTVEAPVTVRIGYGWRSDVAFPNEGTFCTTQLPPAGQVCNYPPSKTIRYRLDASWSGAELTMAQQFVDARVSAMNSQFGAAGWSFSRVGGATAEVTIKKGNETGVSTTSILPYVRVQCANSTTLTQAPGLAGVNRLCNRMDAIIDLAKIDGAFTNATQRERVRGHAFGAAMSPGAGLGYVSGPVDRMHSIAITTGAAKFSAYDSVAACRVNGYDLSNPGQFNTSTTCP